MKKLKTTLVREFRKQKDCTVKQRKWNYILRSDVIWKVDKRIIWLIT